MTATTKAGEIIYAAYGFTEFTVDQLVKGTGVSKETVRRVVSGKVETGELIQTGRGRKGDPIRYRWAPDE